MAEKSTGDQLQDVKGSSLWKDAWRRLLKNKMAVTGAVIVIIYIFLAIFADVIAPHPFEKQNLPEQNLPPSFDHPFGTDSLGRDLFSRVLFGGRISITVGIVTAFVSLVIGVTYGAIAGFKGGKTDEAMMRFVDIMYALPYMFFVILLMVIFGRKFYMLFIGIGAVTWMSLARITRGQIITLKNNEYVEAARSVGSSNLRIIFKHLIPNAIGPIIAYITLTIPTIMLQEAFLSFLGLGIQAPMTSWGILVSEGIKTFKMYPWHILFPGSTMALMLFSLNFLGEGLRDALDPSLKNK